MNIAIDKFNLEGGELEMLHTFQNVTTLPVTWLAKWFCAAILRSAWNEEIGAEVLARVKLSSINQKVAYISEGSCVYSARVITDNVELHNRLVKQAIGITKI